MKFLKSKKSASDGKVFRSGLYSAAITAVVIAAVVLLNLLVRAIPSKYTEFDLSEAGLYTLGDSSKQVARELSQDVTIYYLCETGNEDQIISKLLDKYAAESSHITWELKDPAVYPTFAAQYGAQEASSGSVILVSGDQNVVLDASDLYDYDYSDYYTAGTYSVTFAGENEITSAIYRLTSGEQKHAYYTTNHGEQTLTDTLTDALESQNLSLTALDLLSSGIPEDCDLLIINNPAQDLASAGSLVDEMSLLHSYLSSGGKVLLLTDSYYNTPNLDALMAEFGLTRTEGLVVEGDANHSMNGYPYYLLPDYTSPTETTALDGVDTSRHVLLQMAQGITIATQGYRLGEYREGDQFMPILLKDENIDTYNLTNLQALPIFTPAGKVYSIEQATDGFRFEYRGGVVKRYNRQRVMKAQCDPGRGVNTMRLYAALRDSVLRGVVLPEGYSMKVFGEQESQQESNSALARYMPLTMVLIFIVLLLLFRNYREPVVILLMIPLIFIGVVLGLAVTGKVFNFFSLLGLLGLVGMNIKNAVVLVGQVGVLRSEGKDAYEALTAATRSRIVPVAMASGTTILGMLPLLFDSMFGAMAATIMGGLLVATLLTVCVLPVVYAIFYNIRKS